MELVYLEVGEGAGGVSSTTCVLHSCQAGPLHGMALWPDSQSSQTA